MMSLDLSTWASFTKGTLTDVWYQGGNVQPQHFTSTILNARYIKFIAISYYGSGSGLQYMKIHAGRTGEYLIIHVVVRIFDQGVACVLCSCRKTAVMGECSCQPHTKNGYFKIPRADIWTRFVANNFIKWYSIEILFRWEKYSITFLTIKWKSVPISDINGIKLKQYHYVHFQCSF